MRVAIFGDVGAQLDVFVAGLKSVGMDDEFNLPDDLTVVQVGDLVHKGPHSNEIIEFVDHMITKYPKQWVQLLGNHEGHYLGGPMFWDEPQITEKTIHTIQNWWINHTADIAVGIYDLDNDRHPYLVTHAGLSPIFWVHAKKSPILENTVRQLNNWVVDAAFSPGDMLNGAPHGNGGPAWAHCVTEVYNLWLGHAKRGGKIPFSQIHGHTTPFWWDKNAWSRHAIEEIKEASTLDKETRISITTIGGKRFISTDPAWGKGTQGRTIQYPFVIDNGEIIC